MYKLSFLIWAGLIAALWWWFAPSSPRVSMPSALGDGMVCRFLPPQVMLGQEPLQTTLPADMQPLELAQVKITPVAGYSLQAKVFSKANYRFDKVAAVSHVDLALGWGKMAKDTIAMQFKFRQSKRYGYYRWRYNPPPLAKEEIIRHFANVHLVPSNITVAREIAKIERGDSVRIDGWLINVEHKDGWQIKSSLTRDDSGIGACEVIWVCDVTIEH